MSAKASFEWDAHLFALARSKPGEYQFLGTLKWGFSALPKGLKSFSIQALSAKEVKVDLGLIDKLSYKWAKEPICIEYNSPLRRAGYSASESGSKSKRRREAKTTYKFRRFRRDHWGQLLWCRTYREK